MAAYYRRLRDRGASRKSVTMPRAAAARRPTRIVKLIRYAKSTDAAHGCSALLNGEEAAIGAARTRRILGTPSSIIAGQSGGGCLRQHRWHHNERRRHLQSASASLLVVIGTSIHPSIDDAALAYGPTSKAGLTDSQLVMCGGR